MTISFDTANLVVESTASITDLPAFHAALRDWEDSEEGAIWPVTHTWKALDLGGGAYFYGCDLVNGWTLKFPNPGNYTINGNLNATIIPVAGVYVERKTSAAYVTATGGSGLTAAEATHLMAIPTNPVLTTDARLHTKEESANTILVAAKLAPIHAEVKNTTEVSDAILNAQIGTSRPTGSIGEFFSKKVLTIAKFIGLN